MACFGTLKAMLRPALALSLFAASSATGWADFAPAYVVPTVPGVPIIIAHQDASYAVVEGDWGLGRRPGGVAPTVIRRSRHAVSREEAAHYFPSEGQPPILGRLEIEPPSNRRLPPSAESFQRSWSAGSGQMQQPVTEYPPYNPPPVILAPREAGPRRDGPPRR